MSNGNGCKDREWKEPRSCYIMSNWYLTWSIRLSRSGPLKERLGLSSITLPSTRVFILPFRYLCYVMVELTYLGTLRPSNNILRGEEHGM